MTSKQYYKQTSDMAFKLNDWRYDKDNAVFKANVQMGATKYSTPEELLENEDFFAILGFDEDALGDDEVCYIDELDITFVIDSTHYKTYSLTICDTIDCIDAGGEMVLSCEDYKLLEDVTIDDKDNGDYKTEKKCDGGCKCPHQVTLDWFRPEDFGWFHTNDFHLPDFPNFSNVFDDMTKRIDSLKKDGSQFCEVSYRMDGDGNGHYRKVDNGGVTEKYFKRVDGKVKEVEAPKQTKLEITDESKNDQPGKTELKDLLK